MRYQRVIPCSLVLCNILFANWNTVPIPPNMTINVNGTAPTPGDVLMKSINLPTNTTVNVTATGKFSNENANGCGILACFKEGGNATISGGSLTFNVDTTGITASKDRADPGFFDVQATKGKAPTHLTISSNLTVNVTTDSLVPKGVFRVVDGSSVRLSGDVDIDVSNAKNDSYSFGGMNFRPLFNTYEGSITINEAKTKKVILKGDSVLGVRSNLTFNLSTADSLYEGKFYLKNSNLTSEVNRGKITSDSLMLVDGGSANISFINSNDNTITSITTSGAGASNIDISANTSSKLTSNITNTSGGATTINFDNSELIGKITQTNGTLNVGFVNGGKLTNGIEASNSTLINITGNASNIEGGIKLTNTTNGTINFTGVNFNGGFTGNGSSATFTATNGTFNNADITQAGGSFTGRFTGVGNIKDFNGTGGINSLNLTNTNIVDITQTDGSLKLETSSTTATKVNIQDITTTTATIEMNLIKTSVTGDLSLSGSTGKIDGNNLEIGGDWSQTGGNITGTLDTLTLTGSFTQNGGISNMSFANTNFANNTTLTSATATLNFSNASSLKAVNATGGTNTITLRNSTMLGFNGSNTSINTLSLSNNSTLTGNVAQDGGRMNLGASDNSTITGAVTGTNGSNLSINLSNTSKITSDVANNGTSQIIMNDTSSIGGNVTQTGGNMLFNAVGSTLTRSYTQTGNSLEMNFDRGSSMASMTLTNVTDGKMAFRNGSSIKGNFTATDTTADMWFTNAKIEGKFIQSNGTIEASFSDNSEITRGVTATNTALTTLTFENGSKLIGNVSSTNSQTSINLSNNSTAGSSFSAIGGSLSLIGSINSTFTGNFTATANANTQLNLDASTLKGELTQTGGRQTIGIFNGSVITGSITNTGDVRAVYHTRQRSTLNGSLTQTGGTLGLNMGGDSIIKGSVVLNNVATTLGHGAAIDRREIIEGNLTQNGGSLNGRMDGLNLKGAFTQTNGNSNVIFGDGGNFEQDTTITNATSSNVTFIGSQLQNYTITSGANNILSLRDNTTLTGDFTILQTSTSTLNMTNKSTITGDVKSNDITANILKINSDGSRITKNLLVQNGSVTGVFSNDSSIGQNVTLSETTSNLTFNASKVDGKIDATKGDTTLRLRDNSRVGGTFTQNQGQVFLEISGGSKIGGDTTFDGSTLVTLRGDGANNFITGKLESTATRFDGNVSGLTITETFKQTDGTIEAIFGNNSSIQGDTTITNPAKAHLTFNDGSRTSNMTIDKGTDNQITLNRNSSINGTLSLEENTTKIIATAGSSIVGDISATKNGATSTTTFDFSASAIRGNISQDSGTLSGEFKNGSVIVGNMTLDDVTTNLKFENSSMAGNIGQTNNAIELEASANSNINSTMNIVNATFDANLTTNSILGGSIATNNTSNINLATRANLRSDITLRGGVTKMTISSDNASINSGIIDANGTLTMTMDNNSDGTIGELKSNGANTLTIFSNRNSNNTINALNMSDAATATITVNDSSALRGTMNLNNTSTGTITANTNGNFNMDVNVEAGATFRADMLGGIFQGGVSQGGRLRGEVTLNSNGLNGGRWVVGTSSTINSVEIRNTADLLKDEAQMAIGTLGDTKLSIIDFIVNTDGTIRLGGAMAPKTLTMDRLSGDNGVFRVYTDLGADLSDSVTMNSAEGSHTVQVYYRQDTYTKNIDGKRIVVATVRDNNTKADFVGGKTNIGITTYDTELQKVKSLGATGWDWIIGKSVPMGNSPATKVIDSIMQSKYRTFFIESDTLNKRLGELRDIQRDSGFWARSYFGKNRRDATKDSVAVSDGYTSFWLGFDKNSVGLRGQNFYGVAINYSSISARADEFIGSIKNYGISFYDVWRSNGFYVDMVARYYFSDNSFDLTSSHMINNHPSFYSHTFVANLEMGKKIRIGSPYTRDFYFLEPQLQFTSGYLSSNSFGFKDSWNESINAYMHHTTPLISRLGMFFGREYNSRFKGDLRIGTSFMHEINSGGNLTLSDSANKILINHGWDFKILFSAATNVIINDFWRLYAQADTSFFGTQNITYSINGGVRFVFGGRNNRIKRIPPLPPAPPPSPSEQPVEWDKRNIPVIQDFSRDDINKNYSGKNRNVDAQRKVNPQAPQLQNQELQRRVPMGYGRPQQNDQDSVIQDEYRGNVSGR